MRRRMLVRTTCEAHEVAARLTSAGRLERAAVWPAADGWVAAETDCPAADRAAAHLSATLDTAVLVLGLDGPPALEAYCRGYRLFATGAKGDTGDPAMLSPFAPADVALPKLRSAGVLTPRQLATLLRLPATEGAAPESALAVRSTLRRWWEFWR
jgi:hypothetical protein